MTDFCAAFDEARTTLLTHRVLNENALGIFAMAFTVDMDWRHDETAITSANGRYRLTPVGEHWAVFVGETLLTMTSFVDEAEHAALRHLALETVLAHWQD